MYLVNNTYINTYINTYTNTNTIGSDYSFVDDSFNNSRALSHLVSRGVSVENELNIDTIQYDMHGYKEGYWKSKYQG